MAVVSLIGRDFSWTFPGKRDKATAGSRCGQGEDRIQDNVVFRSGSSIPPFLVVFGVPIFIGGFVFLIAFLVMQQVLVPCLAGVLTYIVFAAIFALFEKTPLVMRSGSISPPQRVMFYLLGARTIGPDALIKYKWNIEKVRDNSSHHHHHRKPSLLDLALDIADAAASNPDRDVFLVYIMTIVTREGNYAIQISKTHATNRTGILRANSEAQNISSKLDAFAARARNPRNVRGDFVPGESQMSRGVASVNLY